MNFPTRASTMLASFLLILMTMGCEGPGGSASATGSLEAERAAEAAAETGGTMAESSSVPLMDSAKVPSGEAFGEPASGADPIAAPVETTVQQSFGAERDNDDPFAVVGPAFSGFGFQGGGSACDPFEDKYGTCL